NDPPAIEPTDDTYRRLLKARLQQGRIEMNKYWEVISLGRWDPTYFSIVIACLNDMRNAALELWGNEPKVLTPWLEEFVIQGKMVEEFIYVRVQVGSDPSQNLYTATRHRLDAEAALWKAKKWRPGKK